MAQMMQCKPLLTYRVICFLLGNSLQVRAPACLGCSEGAGSVQGLWGLGSARQCRGLGGLRAHAAGHTACPLPAPGLPHRGHRPTAVPKGQRFPPRFSQCSHAPSASLSLTKRGKLLSAFFFFSVLQLICKTPN